MEFKDYYKTLGVDPKASQDEIKKAYRRLARKFHPDVSDEADAESRFKDVGEAYEVLRDPEKRKEYDQLRAGGYRAGQGFEPPPDWQPSGGGFRSRESFGEDLGGFSDFFETLFGRGRARQTREPARGRDLHARVEIDLETAVSGGQQRLTLQQPEVGPDGTVRSGRRSLDVRIPPGVGDGQQLRLRGKGEAGPDGRAGDLFLEVRIRPHRLFELDGRNVHLSLPISPWEAALGARVRVPTPGGSVEMNIPEGSSSGRRLRLKGRGLPGKPPGDQYVSLRIVMPPVETPRQRELMETMQREMDFNPRARMEVPS